MRLRKPKVRRSTKLVTKACKEAKAKTVRASAERRIAELAVKASRETELVAKQEASERQPAKSYQKAE